jgi:hypothetical protein
MYKIIFFCLIILSFPDCSGKKQQPEPIKEIDNEVSGNSNNELTKVNDPGVDKLINYINNEKIKFSMVEEKDKINIGEEKLEYWGTVYNTFINDNNVNVRSFPSLSADVLFKANKNTKVVIIGVSKKVDNIDNYIGNWVKVSFGSQEWNSSMIGSWINLRAGNEGWVFSKYVENGLITPSELKIIERLPKGMDRLIGIERLIGMYEINGIEKSITFYPNKEVGQNFYTFAYDWRTDTFHYSNIPGSYAWYPETNELKHITYVGTDDISAWSIFTDDFKYLLQDFGTAKGPRKIEVWRIADEKKIFSGAYYKYITFYNNTINIIYVYDDWHISNGILDDEILDYGKNFIENNPEPEENNTGFHLTLIINCMLNLDSNTRTIIGGEYIYTE